MVPAAAVASLERDRRASSGTDPELRTPTSSAVPASDYIIVSFLSSELITEKVALRECLVPEPMSSPWNRHYHGADNVLG